MTSKGFDPEKDLAPIPFDESICMRALEMKRNGLIWRPHVGCFVWDPEEFIKPASPFPGRIYFILSISRFLEIFDSIEEIIEKLVWLPTWHQAMLVCRQLGVLDDISETMRESFRAFSQDKGLFEIYGLILKALKR
jgi:hypothetical protein